jgi:hypothetical protein
MSEADLERLLAAFDARARAAQQRLEAQRRHVDQFRQAVNDWILPLFERIAARLESSGHEAEISMGGDASLTHPGVDPGHHVQLRVVPRPLPGLRVSRPLDRQPLLRLQLDAPEGVVRFWARDVSLDGRDVAVGYRNDAEGLPLGVPLDALDADLVWQQTLETLDFALRESAQEDLFTGSR